MHRQSSEIPRRRETETNNENSQKKEQKPRTRERDFGLTGIQIFERHFERFVERFEEGKEREFIRGKINEIFKADEQGFFSTEEAKQIIGILSSKIINSANTKIVAITEMEPVQDPEMSQKVAWREKKRLTSGIFMGIIGDYALVAQTHQALKKGNDQLLHTIGRYDVFGGKIVLVRREHLNNFS